MAGSGRERHREGRRKRKTVPGGEGEARETRGQEGRGDGRRKQEEGDGNNPGSSEKGGRGEETAAPHMTAKRGQATWTRMRRRGQGRRCGERWKQSKGGVGRGDSEGRNMVTRAGRARAVEVTISSHAAARRVWEALEACHQGEQTTPGQRRLR
ncbi:hypothetical protein EDB85DRAFT_750609 [Lactarius pseudohatsudake]|nr:hypothetical protein EDB85DRAFT_750609 [Lactarius pseudohatsudake]